MVNLIKNNGLLIIAVIISILFNFYHVDYQSIWLDEIHSINEANPSVSLVDLYAIIKTGEQMPPLYFYILYFLFKVFGYKTIVGRLLSAFIGVITVYAIYLLGKKLYNNKAGQIAALLLSVNYFHLYYSQEIRPYVFFELFTILSFYGLILFIINQKLRNALCYGLFTALMIYGHFFGLFIVLSQIFILLVILFYQRKENVKVYLLRVLLAGIVAFILLIPTIPIFIKVLGIKVFWIPAPQPNTLYLIYKEFFGYSLELIIFTGMFFILYVFGIFTNKKNKKANTDITQNADLLNRLILFSWIGITVLLPLVKSYLSASVMISRYFIGILPALLILFAIGIQQFKKRYIIILLLVFSFFSIRNTVKKRKYYKTKHKTEFREATKYIIKNNTNNNPVVTSLEWYMHYFLQNDTVNLRLIDQPLEEYLKRVKRNELPKQDFWYIDGHVRPYKVSDEIQKYIDTTFYIEHNFEGYDVWTKHFIKLEDKPITLDISKYTRQKQNGNKIGHNVDVFKQEGDSLEIKGWAFFLDQDYKFTKTQLFLIKDQVAYRIDTEMVMRQDVAPYFKLKNNLDNCGFVSKQDITGFEQGIYTFGIYLEDKITDKEGVVITDLKVTVE